MGTSDVRPPHGEKGEASDPSPGPIGTAPGRRAQERAPFPAAVDGPVMTALLDARGRFARRLALRQVRLARIHHVATGVCLWILVLGGVAGAVFGSARYWRAYGGFGLGVLALWILATGALFVLGARSAARAIDPTSAIDDARGGVRSVSRGVLGLCRKGSPEAAQDAAHAAWVAWSEAYGEAVAAVGRLCVQAEVEAAGYEIRMPDPVWRAAGLPSASARLCEVPIPVLVSRVFAHAAPSAGRIPDHG